MRNLTTSWTSGLAFNALLHKFTPEAFDYDAVHQGMTSEQVSRIGQSRLVISLTGMPGNKCSVAEQRLGQLIRDKVSLLI